MSAALERVFGRHVAEAQALSGIYGPEIGADDDATAVLAMTAEFERNEGRRPRILVAKIGQDGHDRGQKVIASAFADLGFDVDIGPLFATPEEAARQAIASDAHVVGVSTLAAGHLTLVPALKSALEAAGRGDILVVVGGVVPPQDYAALEAAGVAAIFPPGTDHRGSRRKAPRRAQPQARLRADGRRRSRSLLPARRASDLRPPATVAALRQRRRPRPVSSMRSPASRPICWTPVHPGQAASPR